MEAQKLPEENLSPGARALMSRQQTALSAELAGPQIRYDEEETGVDLREYWEILKRRKWTLITFFLITVVSTAIASFLMTPTYRATTTLQIERETPKIVSYQNLVPAEAPHEKDFYQTQYELLKSRSLAERVIGQLDLLNLPAFQKDKTGWRWWPAVHSAGTQAAETQAAPADPLEGIVRAFQDALTIEPVKSSRLVRVHFDSTDPVLAAKVANAVAKSFIDMNLERRMDSASYAKKFLEEHLQQIRLKLQDSERDLVEFARREKIIELEDKRSAVSQKLQELNAALARAEEERIKANALYQQIRNARSQSVKLMLDSPVIQKLKENKAKLEADYQEGLKIYKPAYPTMVKLQTQIAEVQKKIEDEEERIRLAVKTDLDAAIMKEKLLAAKLDEAKQELLSLQDRSIQYNILKREVETNRQLYDGLLQRMKEVGVAGGVGLNNISVVDKAEVPSRRHKPRIALNLLLAAFLGMFGGIGLAFLFEHLDDTLKSPEETERLLSLPMLGVIPAVQGGADGNTGNRHLALLSHHDPRSAFAEAYRTVRTALQFSTPVGAPKVLVVTSPSQGEGKTTTAVSLAIQFAQMGTRTLLVDADLRRPSLHHALQADNGRGLTNYLAGEATPAEIVKPSFVPNLFFIPSGPLPPNPADLLASAKMLSLLSLAGEKFGCVIVDSPPVLGLADAPILASVADGAILVLAHRGSRRGMAEHAVKRLRGARANLIGGVVTKHEASSRSYGYHQYYYYDHGVKTLPRQTA